MKHFGVGCFYLSPKLDISRERITVRRLLEDLRASFQKIRSVDNLRLTVTDEELDESRSISITEERDELLFGVSHLALQFDIRINAATQIEICGIGTAAILGTEVFKVSAFNAYHGPVCFVECVDAPDHCQASTSVRLVREFLKEQLAIVGGAIKTIGPSPFHADFSLTMAKLDDHEPFKLLEIKEIGYDTISIHANEEIFDNSNEALEALFSGLKYEFDTFYEIVRLRNHSLMRWSGIEELVAEYRFRGLNENLILIAKRFLRQGSVRNKLISELYSFAADHQSMLSHARQLIAADRNKTPNSIVLSHAERTLVDVIDFPITSHIEWLKHEEGRLLKKFEIGAALLAGLVGGVFGAIATRVVAP